MNKQARKNNQRQTWEMVSKRNKYYIHFVVSHAPQFRPSYNKYYFYHDDRNVDHEMKLKVPIHSFILFIPIYSLQFPDNAILVHIERFVGKFLIECNEGAAFSNVQCEYEI